MNLTPLEMMDEIKGKLADISVEMERSRAAVRVAQLEIESERATVKDLLAACKVAQAFNVTQTAIARAERKQP